MTLLGVICLLYGGLALGVLLALGLARLTGVPVAELGLGVGRRVGGFASKRGLAVTFGIFPGGYLRVPGWTRTANEPASYLALHGRRDLAARALVAAAVPLVLFGIAWLTAGPDGLFAHVKSLWTLPDASISSAPLVALALMAVNLLPIPGSPGGLLLLLAIEAVRGEQLSVRAESKLLQGALYMFLAAFFAVVLARR